MAKFNFNRLKNQADQITFKDAVAAVGKLPAVTIYASAGAIIEVAPSLIKAAKNGGELIEIGMDEAVESTKVWRAECMLDRAEELYDKYGDKITMEDIQGDYQKLLKKISNIDFSQIKAERKARKAAEKAAKKAKKNQPAGGNGGQPGTGGQP